MSDLRPRYRASRAVRRRRTIVVVVIVAAVILGGAAAAVFALRPSATVAAASNTPAGRATPTPTATSTPTPSPSPTPSFNKSALSIDDPASYWVVVNKLRTLNPIDYAPADLVSVPVPQVNESYLRQAASDAVVAMFAAFQTETGLQMQSQSAYRSYSTQEAVYAGWVSSLGQAAADQTSARAGHSEHQTGLAIDVSALPSVCALDQCFANTPQGQWLAANGWKYGFIVRYPADKTAVTGYEYEPWHMRYVGTDLAAEMHRDGIETLEEFFGLPAAPDYAP